MWPAANTEPTDWGVTSPIAPTNGYQGLTTTSGAAVAPRTEAEHGIPRRGPVLRRSAARTTQAAGKVCAVATRVEDLCEQHRDLPAIVSRQIAACAPPYVHPEDLEPAAWDGLYRAAVSWQPDGAAGFRTWAKYRIHGVIRDQMRMGVEHQRLAGDGGIRRVHDDNGFGAGRTDTGFN